MILEELLNWKYSLLKITILSCISNTAISKLLEMQKSLTEYSWQKNE